MLYEVITSAHCLDQSIVPTVRHGLAQAPYVHIHRTVFYIDIGAPHIIQQLLAAVHSLGMGHEEMQQPELGRPHVYCLLVDRYPMGNRIQAQALDIDHFRITSYNVCYTKLLR